MAVSLSALVFSTILAFGTYLISIPHDSLVSYLQLVIRQILVKRNKEFDANDKLAMEGVDRARVEEAAKLEGITFEQAIEKRKGFRYLY